MEDDTIYTVPDSTLSERFATTHPVEHHPVADDPVIRQAASRVYARHVRKAKAEWRLRELLVNSAAVIGLPEPETEPDPVGRQLLGIGTGYSVIVDGYAEPGDKADNIPTLPDWEDLEERSTVFGALVLCGKLGGASHVITPDSGAPMTPGFDRIDLLSNEGMLAHINGLPFVVEAANPLLAARRYLIRGDTHALAAYPLFLHADKLAVTRLDPDSSHNIHNTALRLLRSDNFGNAEDLAGHDAGKASEKLELILSVVHDHEKKPRGLVEFTFDPETEANTEYFPAIDHNNLRAQMIVSRPLNGGIIVTLAGTMDKLKNLQGGFIFIKRPNGHVMMTGVGHEDILYGDDRQGMDPYGKALDCFLRYNGGFLKKIFEQPIRLSNGTVINPW